MANKAKGIVPPTLEELTQDPNNSNSEGHNDATTIADNVFKGYRDDLDFIDENDVGE
jgi:cytochrome P450 family 4